MFMLHNSFSIWLLIYQNNLTWGGKEQNAWYPILITCESSFYLIAHWIFAWMYWPLAKLISNQKVLTKADRLCMNAVLYAVSFLIVMTCTLQGIANSICRENAGNPPPIIHAIEKITDWLFDVFLAVDCVIIAVAIVKIWRAPLFAQVRGMSAKRSMLIVHLCLLAMIIIGRVIYAVG